MDPMQCPHCGDVFDDKTFEAHLAIVASKATPTQVANWLLQWADERSR